MIVICMVAETLVEAWVVRAQRKNLCFGGRGHPSMMTTGEEIRIPNRKYTPAQDFGRWCRVYAVWWCEQSVGGQRVL